MKTPSFKRWLYKMEYKYSRHAIQNLMLVITAGMLIVLVGSFINPGISSYLTLNRSAILSGQVWRLVTFIFVPPISSNIFFTLLGIYFYYFVGSTLESTWGSMKFNIYYLCGIIGLIVSTMVTGYADTFYLNMSLFFAFSVLYPENQVLLFFVIPVKMKWLGVLNAVMFAFNFMAGGWATRGAIIAVLVVFLIFFWSETIGLFRKLSSNNTQRNFKKNYKPNGNNTINWPK